MTSFEIAVAFWIIYIYICVCMYLYRQLHPHHSPRFEPGPRFPKGFSIAIQIRWKLCFTLTSILIRWSLQNFAHGTTTLLSWHVQKFVAIWWPAAELHRGEISIDFELRAKKTLVKLAPGHHYVQWARQVTTKSENQTGSIAAQLPVKFQSTNQNF